MAVITMPRTQIVMNVSGGIVQDVFASVDVDLLLVDWDTDDWAPADPELVTIDTAYGRTVTARVAEMRVLPLSDLAGTDVGAAVEGSEFAFA